MRVMARPLIGGVVITCLLVLAAALGWLPFGSGPTAVKIAPVLTPQQDLWHVNAALPGVTRFTFVVRVAGSADVFADNVASPYVIDPVTFGGRSVSVSARAAGRKSNPWATAVKIDVPPAQPFVTVAADRWHIEAKLPGTSTFTFLVKTAGLPDTYVGGVSPPFAIDRAKYGGRTVSVSARTDRAPSAPWAPEVMIEVPQLKLFGVSNPTGLKVPPGADEKELGITLDRIELTYPQSTASMDSKIAHDTSQGLTPLVLLSQTSTTIPGAVLPVSGFDVEGWKKWASTIVARYGPGGTFWKGRTDGRYAPSHFEVLNEPYGSWFYTPPEPAAYAKFFVAVVTAAKKANPRAKFLLAGFPNTYMISGNTYSTTSWDSQLKSSPDGAAAQQLADGITVHPYGPPTADRGWPSAVATHADFPQLPVWITEVGYRLGEVIDGVTVTPDTQAALMQRSLEDYVSWPWAQAYVWFTWYDYDDARSGAHNWYGLVDSSGAHRPAYDIYRRFIMSNTSGP